MLAGIAGFGAVVAGSIGVAARRLTAPSTAIPLTASSNYQGTPGVVTADELADLIARDDPRIVLVDLSDHRRYAAAHIPDAVHGWWQDGMEWNAFSYGQVVDNTEIEDERMRWIISLGISPDSRVIAYDDDRGRRAARLVWTLGMIGIVDGAILDGGIGALKGAGFDVTSAPTDPVAVSPFVEAPTDGWRMLTDPLRDRIGSNGITLVDVRTDEERASTLNDTVPLGEIPGSVRFPRTAVLDPGTGLFLPLDVIGRLMTDAGIDQERPIVLYGLFGQDTALVWLMLRALGYENEIIVYDEGWTYWATQPDLPTTPIQSSSA